MSEPPRSVGGMEEVGVGESGTGASDADAFLYEHDVCEWDGEAGWVPPRPDAVALVLEAADLEAV